MGERSLGMRQLFYGTGLVLISSVLILMLGFLSPSYSDDIDELPMPQEKYESLTDGAKAIIEEKRKECKEDYDNGTVTVLNHAVTKLRVGRNDDYKQTLTTVEVINYGGLVCSTSMRGCGSGGCPVKLLVNDTEQYLGAIQGIEEVQVDTGEYILIVAEHGSVCDTAGYNYCYVALRWDGERFLWKKP